MMYSENTKEIKATWRISEREFLRKVDVFIDEEYPKIIEFSKTIKNTTKGVGKELNDIFSKIRSVNYTDKNSLRSLKLSAIMKDDRRHWLEWSTQKHEPEEIIFRVLLNKYFDVYSLCYSYMCTVDELLSEKLIEDIMFINSDLFDFDYWDDYHVDIVTKIMTKGNKSDCTEDLQLLLESNIKLSDKFKNNIRILLNSCDTKCSSTPKKCQRKIILRERLDWYNIDKHQNISNSFRIKYKDLIKKSYESVDNNEEE